MARAGKFPKARCGRLCGGSGTEGWELVTKTDFPLDVSGEGGYEMYFKRALTG
jgi:hypothetical protein